MKNIIKPQSSKPLLIVGISLGGHLALRYAQERPDETIGVFSIVPMININTYPYPRWLARWIVTSATWGGFGKKYAIGYGDYNFNLKINPDKIPTSDLNRYQRQLDLNKNYRHFITAGPTYRWVYESFKSIDILKNPYLIKKISVPLMIINAEYDAVVDPSEDESFCAQIPQCKIKTYKNARHNIFIETDEIRDQLFKDFDGFVKRCTQ